MNANNIKVSVIMPVHNSEQYLARSISSVIEQTLPEIELICIDDFSKDNSLTILKRYASQDNRIKIINYTSNKSAFQARKDGIHIAAGKYIMFLDADDYLEKNACESLYKEIENRKVDIIHFNSNIISYNVSKNRIDFMENFVKPYIKKIDGIDVFKSCFETDKYKFNLWNKIYLSSVCKKAIKILKDGYYPKANDLLLFFAIAYCATSYQGIDSPPYYNYCFGLGSTGSSTLTLEKFQTYCYEANAAKYLMSLSNTIHLENLSTNIILKLKYKLLDECIWNWNENLPKDLSQKGLDILLSTWGREDTITGMARKLHNNSKQIAEKIIDYPGLKIRKSKIKKIGIFYYRMAKGGVQRVISLLIPLYIQMGYEIILFTDEFDPENEYKLPQNVKIVILPSVLNSKPEDFDKRVKIFTQGLIENDVDLMLYHAAANEMLLFDILIVKSLGIPFVMTVHELFSQSMVTLNTMICQRKYIYQLVDKLIVLSTTEEAFWNLFNINVQYLQNPIDQFNSTYYSGDYILWIGRLEKKQKRYMDAIEIMKLVTEKFPDERMKIVGNEVTKGALEEIKQKIHEYNLENNIEICGFQLDVSTYYQNAKIHLVTSLYEAFPMTIIESKSYGIPLVTYSMPYLELLRDYTESYISVEPKNIKMAAYEIIQLLNNKNKLLNMSYNAKESIKSFYKTDLKKEWEKIFEEIIISDNKKVISNKKYNKEIYRNIVDAMLLHYSTGSLENQEKLKKLKKEKWDLEKLKGERWKELHVLKKEKGERWKELQELRKDNLKLKKERETLIKELDDFKSSETYKIGQIVSYVPKQILSLFRKSK